MAVHITNQRVGFGNVLIFLSDYLTKAGMDGLVNKNLLDFGRGRAFDFKVNLTDREDGDRLETFIFCNPGLLRDHGSIMKQTVFPTKELTDLFSSHAHVLDGVTLGVHIRCGSSVEDSKGLAAPNDGFVSNLTFEVIDEIIKNNPGRVFLASDSKRVKNLIKGKWGSKITTLDSDITLSCEPDVCGGIEQNSKSLMDVYLDWYMLSKCPSIVTTAGRLFLGAPDGAGISTFGYTAAAYGTNNLKVVAVNGQVFDFST